MNEKGKDQVIKRKEGKMKEVKRKNDCGWKGREGKNKIKMKDICWGGGNERRKKG